jgi:hypothetical protein
MSECQWSFGTLLNFHRPSWAYDISNNFLTFPNEHTVLSNNMANMTPQYVQTLGKQIWETCIQVAVMNLQPLGGNNILF